MNSTSTQEHLRQPLLTSGTPSSAGEPTPTQYHVESILVKTRYCQTIWEQTLQGTLTCQSISVWLLHLLDLEFPGLLDLIRMDLESITCSNMTKE